MRIEPIYPLAAVRNALEGGVTLSYDIDTDGSVSNVAVIKSLHDGLFDASAILALRQWRYTAPERKLINQLVEFEFVIGSNDKVIDNETIEHIFIKSR